MVDRYSPELVCTGYHEEAFTELYVPGMRKDEEGGFVRYEDFLEVKGKLDEILKEKEDRMKRHKDLMEELSTFAEREWGEGGRMREIWEGECVSQQPRVIPVPVGEPVKLPPPKR